MKALYTRGVVGFYVKRVGQSGLSVSVCVIFQTEFVINVHVHVDHFVLAYSTATNLKRPQSQSLHIPFHWCTVYYHRSAVPMYAKKNLNEIDRLEIFRN